MTVPIRVAGIIGCGVIAPTHAESFRALEGVELAWACDLVPAKARALARTYGIPQTTTDFEDVLKDPNVTCVAVCTDHASHVPIVLAALEHGKHVLCEKALVANRQQLDMMFVAHKQHANLVFSAVSQHRFDAVNQRLRHYMREGLLGAMLTAHVHVLCYRSDEYYAADAWRGTWQYEGGSVLINQSIHFIDMLAWIMGGVTEVCGTHKNMTHHGVIETEDTAVAALRFRNGALGTLAATASSNVGWEHTLIFNGTLGSIEIRNGQPGRIAFADAAVQAKVIDELKTCRDAAGVNAGKSYYGTGHAGQVADFIAAIRDRRDPYVSAADVRNTVQIVLAVYESQKSGAWVELAE